MKSKNKFLLFFLGLAAAVFLSACGLLEKGYRVCLGGSYKDGSGQVCVDKPNPGLTPPGSNGVALMPP